MCIIILFQFCMPGTIFIKYLLSSWFQVGLAVDDVKQIQQSAVRTKLSLKVIWDLVNGKHLLKSPFVVCMFNFWNSCFALLEGYLIGELLCVWDYCELGYLLNAFCRNYIACPAKGVRVWYYVKFFIHVKSAQAN